DGRLELLFRLLELCLRGRFGLASGEDRVVLRLHLQRDVVLLRHLVRLRGADVELGALHLVPATAAIEEIDRRREAGAVRPWLRREVGHETPLRIETLAGLIHLAERDVEVREQRGLGGTDAGLRGADLAAGLNGAQPVLFAE